MRPRRCRRARSSKRCRVRVGAARPIWRKAASSWSSWTRCCKLYRNYLPGFCHKQGVEMVSVKEQLIRDIQRLSEARAKQVAEYLAFMEFRERRRVRKYALEDLLAGINENNLH